VAQDLLQLQQDVRAILKADQRLEARQRLAGQLGGKKAAGGDDDEGDRGSGSARAAVGDGAEGNSTAGSAAPPPAAVVLDVQPAAAAATGTASTSVPAVITGSPAVQVVGGPPGSPNSTLDVNLDQLVAQIRAGQIVGEPDGRGGSTITIGDGSGQQPGANMTRSLTSGTTLSTAPPQAAAVAAAGP
jgi:hypothetical protein